MHVFKSLPVMKVELINNQLHIMSPSPSPVHQDILAELNFSITAHVKKNKMGKVCFAPYDVFLDEQFNAVQPDLMFISNDRMQIMHKDAIHGSPDLIIEIQSRWNPNHDKLTKKLLYEIFGVREYFIVDPESKTVFGFRHVNDRFDRLPVRKGVICSTVLKKNFSF